jgi:hypothetical protein
MSGEEPANLDDRTGHGSLYAPPQRTSMIDSTGWEPSRPDTSAMTLVPHEGGAA